MTRKHHDIESLGANPRDHTHPPRPYWKRAHRDWRAWTIAAILLALMLVYVMTDSLALSPGDTGGQPVPEMSAP